MKLPVGPSVLLHPVSSTQLRTEIESGRVTRISLGHPISEERLNLTRRSWVMFITSFLCQTVLTPLFLTQSWVPLSVVLREVGSLVLPLHLCLSPVIIRKPRLGSLSIVYAPHAPFTFDGDRDFTTSCLGTGETLPLTLTYSVRYRPYAPSTNPMTLRVCDFSMDSGEMETKE